MNTREELIRMKEDSGMSWRRFAEYFDIPYRTMQDWQLGNRRMPDYLLQLMLYKVEVENLAARDENRHTLNVGK
ncbi:MAG: transcriptional regulator [Eubacterium sp.]|nr:transcriptional regulator [Eubacterium sp.]